jgi:PKD repeat protein
MLGVVADPAFASNGFVYVYYSASSGGTCVNRVSRFTLDSSSHIAPSSEKILIDGIRGDGFHNGGDLVFGRDGDLYVSVGDGHCLEGCDPSNQAAQDLKNLNGKILRINPDGSVPSGNPFSGSGTARCNTGAISSGKCQEIYAYGFRNPFRIALDPNASGTRIFVNDVGQNTTEEVDQLQAGGDYGWPQCEGPCNTPGLIDPYFSYPDSQGGGRAAITGGAFVPDGAWNSAYNGKYLFSDYVKNNLYSISASGASGTGFSTFSGGATAITMRFAPQNRGGTGTQQALYYTNLVTGTVHMITSGATVPTASFTTQPGGAVSYCSTHATTAGAPPLAVNFDGSASSDPNGLALTYHWVFGDGATQTTTTPTTSHTYTTIGDFTPTLTVTNSSGGTSTAASGTVRTDDAPPTIAITAPTPSTTFTVGQTYTPAGTATDSHGTALPASALTWQVWLFHINHVHPVLDPVAGNGNTSFAAPPAEQFSAIAGNSRLLICLSATDSSGVTQTIEQDFDPTLVHLTMATQPAGLKVHIDEDDVDSGGIVTGPATVTSWAGYQIHLTAANQTDSSGQQWNFASWSDGGAQAHAVTPTSDTTYGATFTQGTVQNAIVNGGFETGDFTGWTRSGTTAIVGSPVHSGTHAVLLGSANPTNGDSKVSQTFTAPTGATQLSFYYDMNCPDAVTYDWATATLKDNTTGTTATPLAKTCTLGAGWKQVSAPIVAGHSYTLTLVSHDENNPGDPTDTVYDDISVG